MLDIIYGETSSSPASRQLQAEIKNAVADGTLYLGYPVLASADEKVFIDALLISPAHGLTIFDLSSLLSPRPTEKELADLSAKQDQIHAFIFNKLNAHKELRSGRSLALKIRVVTFHPSLLAVSEVEELIASPPGYLKEILAKFEPIDERIVRPLNAAIQRVSTLRPIKKREGVMRQDSRGAVLKKLEKEIANLDQWQNRGAIEYVNGPQRIRGLAGSGKTVVLALKAAVLHGRHPEWRIAVTFQSRALYQQFRDLIRRFVFEQTEDEPNWNNLMIMHAWGGARPGVYSMLCGAYDVPYEDWRSADAKYGARAFEGVCRSLNRVVIEKGAKPIFDAVLVDEAQDFPTAFYRLMYSTTADPHRIIWAYDDLQNLGDYQMRSEHELFGSDKNGNPYVSLKNEPDQPKQDIVLPVCYRNTPWVLATAHALGFGIYRKPEGLVQIFAEPSIWERIGYEKIRGSLQLDQDVAVRRSPDSYPPYFGELLQPDDVIKHKTFETPADQYQFLAEEIAKNLGEDELEATDILIVLPSAYTSKKTGSAIMSALADRGIASHLAGVTSSVDQIFQEHSIAITHIYRAKGNEAPMVYIVNADYCQAGLEMSRKRNILFTAITRSRCWVRIFGVGPPMDALTAEIEAVRANDYQLSFHYPDAEQIKKLANVHRDMSDRERRELERKFDATRDLVRALRTGELPLNAVPEDMQDLLSGARDVDKDAPG